MVLVGRQNELCAERDRGSVAVALFALLALCTAACSVRVTTVCPSADGDTVALYRFTEGSGTRFANDRSLSEALGGSINDGGREPVSWVTEDAPCGGGLHFPVTAPTGETSAFAWIDDQVDWQLEEGAVELWVRFDATSEPYTGILSRDMRGSRAGSLTVFRGRAGDRNHIGVRIESGIPGDDTSYCSATTVGDGTWHHLSISFGGSRPIAVAIDGVAAARLADYRNFGPFECGASPGVGLESAAAPWIVGALGVDLAPGKTAPAMGGLGGSITGLRIGGARRDLGPPPEPVNQPGAASFGERCGHPDVVLCVGFDADDEVAGKLRGGAPKPALDPTVKASGASSLKFTVSPNTGPYAMGDFMTNFAPDYSVQFGAGEEFFVQWRQRFDDAFINNSYPDATGWVQAIIGEGDRTAPRFDWCDPLRLVVQNSYFRGFPHMTHSCGAKDGRYSEHLTEPIDAQNSDFYLQNAIRAPGCLYSLGRTGQKWTPPCLGYQGSQWMTFQVRVRVGSWYANDGVYRHDSTVQLWVAEEGQPSQLVIDFRPRDAACAAVQQSTPACRTGYDLRNPNPDVAKYGKIWLIPHHTAKLDTQNHPTAHTWYDELIVSRSRIADPQ